MNDLPRPGDLHTTVQAAEVLDVPAAVIRKWAHRGQVAVAGYVHAAAPGGRIPLYYLDELRPLAAKYHARR